MANNRSLAMNLETYELYDIWVWFEEVKIGQNFVDIEGNLWRRCRVVNMARQGEINCYAPLADENRLVQTFFDNDARVRVLAIRE